MIRQLLINNVTIDLFIVFSIISQVFATANASAANGESARLHFKTKSFDKIFKKWCQAQPP